MHQHTEGVSSRSVKVLVWLESSLRSQVRGQILGGDNIPTLTATFSSVMHVSTGPDATTAPSIEQFAVVSGRGRGRGLGRDFVGRGSFGGGCGLMVVDRLLVIRGSGNICNDHISEKCWEKFGHSEWAQLVDTDTHPSGDITYAPAPSVTHSGTSGSPTVVLSREEYDRLC